MHTARAKQEQLAGSVTLTMLQKVRADRGSAESIALRPQLESRWPAGNNLLPRAPVAATAVDYANVAIVAPKRISDDARISINSGNAAVG